MSEPLSIFKTTFLHYEMLKEPSEMMARAMFYKKNKKSTNTTKIVIALYTKGFFLKGNLNHISGDIERLRTNQFVSAGLLRNVMKLQTGEESLIVIFHETIEMKIEALLLNFFDKSIKYCEIFLKYLKILSTERYCSIEVLDSFKVDKHKIKPRQNKTVKTEHNYSIQSDNNEIKEKIIKKRELSVKFGYLNRNENLTEKTMLQESFIPITTNTRISTNTPIPTNTQISTNTPIPTNTQIPTNTPIPTTTAIPTNTQISTNTILSEDNFNHNYRENNYSENVMSTDLLFKEENIHKENEKILRNYFEDKHKSTINSNSENGISTDILYNQGNILNEDKVILENYFEDSLQYNKDTNETYLDESDPGIIYCPDNFSWPEFLLSDTSSMVIEMSHKTYHIGGNWSLLNNYIKLNSLDNKDSSSLEWEERVDRLQYDHFRKKYQIDDNGSLLIYCCRQVSKPKELSN